MGRGAQWGPLVAFAAVFGAVWWRFGAMHAGPFSQAVGAAALGRLLWLHHGRNQPQQRIRWIWFAMVLALLRPVLVVFTHSGTSAPGLRAAPAPRPCAASPASRTPDECGLDALRPGPLGPGRRGPAVAP